MTKAAQPIEIDPAWLPAWAVEDLSKKPVITVKWSRGERKMLRRKVKMRPSDWAAKNIMVPADSPLGKVHWNPSITPYWVGVMDASFYPSVQEICIGAVPQSGKSQAIANCIGYAIDRAPGNVLMVCPDEKSAGDFAKDRMIPLIEDSRIIRSFTTGYVDDLSSLRIKLRHVKIFMGWANSAARLASRPLPYGVADEENKYPVTTSKEENTPIDLIRMRQRNFAHMRKLWRASSKTVENVGIDKALAECEAVFDYHAACRNAMSCN